MNTWNAEGSKPHRSFPSVAQPQRMRDSSLAEHGRLRAQRPFGRPFNASKCLKRKWAARTRTGDPLIKRPGTVSGILWNKVSEALCPDGVALGGPSRAQFWAQLMAHQRMRPRSFGRFAPA